MLFLLAPIPKKTQLIIGGIYFATFILFLLFEKSWIDTLYGFPVHNGGDSAGYVLLAQNLLEHGTFSYSQKVPLVLEALRSPGYPLFISSVLAVFRLPEIISVLQLIFSFLTGWLVYDLLKERLDNSWSILGASLFWFNPTVLFYSITALSDVLFVFLEVLIFWLLWKKRNTTSYVLSSFLLGFAILVRPAGSYLGFILLVWVCILLYKDVVLKTLLKKILLMTLTVLCVVTPWMYRNYVNFGRFEISSVGPYTLLFFSMEAFRESKGESREEIEKAWLTEIGAPSRELVSSPTYSEKTMRVFKRELFSNIYPYSLFQAKGMVQFFLGSGLSDVSNNTGSTKTFLAHYKLGFVIPLLSWVERIFMLCLFILFITSSLFVCKDKKYRMLVFGSVAIALYMAAIVGPIPNPRYRLAALPFIIIPAMYSLQHISKKRIAYIKNNSIPK